MPWSPGTNRAATSAGYLSVGLPPPQSDNQVLSFFFLLSHLALSPRRVWRNLG